MDRFWVRIALGFAIGYSLDYLFNYGKMLSIDLAFALSFIAVMVIEGIHIYRLRKRRKEGNSSDDILDD